MMSRTVVLLVGLVVASVQAPSAKAQPCGSYRNVTLGEARLRPLEHGLRVDLATADEPRKPPLDRVAAFARVLGRVSEIDRLFGLCDRPDPAEEARLLALGIHATSPVMFRRGVVERCVAVIRRAHLSGSDAHTCLAALDDHVQRGAASSFPRPPPPARWRDAPDPSAVYETMTRELRARPRDAALRLDLARIQLASADPVAAIATLRPIRTTFDAGLLHAIATYATSRVTGADQRFVAAMRTLAARALERVEPHLAIAETECFGEYLPCAQALAHARIAACVPADRESRARAEARLAELLHRTGEPHQACSTVLARNPAPR